MAAAGVGHRLEQGLVEIGAEPEGRRRNSAITQLGCMADELVVVGNPDVRQAVGQEQATIDATARLSDGDLLATGQPTGREVGAAAPIDHGQALSGQLARLARCGAPFEDDVDAIVVDHDRDPIVAMEPGQGGLDRGLGQVELAATRHRARAIENEAEVHGWPDASRVRRDGRRGHVDQQEALGGIGEWQQHPVGPDRDAARDGKAGVGIVGHGVLLVGIGRLSRRPAGLERG